MNRRIVYAGLVVAALVVAAGSLGFWVRRSREAERERLSLCTSLMTGAEAALKANDGVRAKSLVSTVRNKCDEIQFPALMKIDQRIADVIEAKHKAAVGAVVAARKQAELELAEVTATFAPVWTAYEKLPHRSKSALATAVRKVATIQNTLPVRLQPMGIRYNRAILRAASAPLILPPTRARGDWYEILVPSHEPAACIVWGSGWSNDPAALIELGFVKIHCDAAPGGRAVEWELSKARADLKEATTYIDAQWGAYDEIPQGKRTVDDLRFAFKASIMVMVGLQVKDENRNAVVTYNLRAYRPRAVMLGLTGNPTIDGM